MSDGHHVLKKSKISSNSDEGEDSYNAFDKEMQEKLFKADKEQSTPKNKKSSRVLDKNGYVPEAHENVHASGKKMRHEHDQKHIKHHKKEKRDNAEKWRDRQDNK
jgi:hypothetical protein